MRKTPRFTLGLTLAAALTLGTAGTALADHVPPHQHTLTTPGGTHDIAGGLCVVGAGEALDHFHGGVHFGQPRDAFASNAVSISSTGC